MRTGIKHLLGMSATLLLLLTVIAWVDSVAYLTSIQIGTPSGRWLLQSTDGRTRISLDTASDDWRLHHTRVSFDRSQTDWSLSIDTDILGVGWRFSDPDEPNLVFRIAVSYWLILVIIVPLVALYLGLLHRRRLASWEPAPDESTQ